VAKKSVAKPTTKKSAAKPVAKKSTTKPVTKKSVAKPVAKKSVAKPTAKKSAAKPAAKKSTTKPVTKKSVTKPVAKKSAAKPTAIKSTVKLVAKKSAAKPEAKKLGAKSDTIAKPITTLKKTTTVKQTASNTPSKQFVPYAPSNGEEYMNGTQLGHFRKILEGWKEELSQDIDRTVHTMQDEATVFADPNDRASQESDMALELRNRDRERKLIKKIDETIGKIEAGDYGYCESCGVEIGLKRLEARPTATLCIDCKTLDELREKQVAK
jgi:DnaK suppressor protein